MGIVHMYRERRKISTFSSLQVSLLERSWSASTMSPTVHVHAVETCENVREVLTLVFFAANTRDETSSLALEQSGVITKET